MPVDRRLGFIAAAAALAIASMAAATQMLAARFDHQTALGARLRLADDIQLYSPLAIFTWSKRWSGRYPAAFAAPKLVVFAGSAAALAVLMLALRPLGPKQKRFGADAWGRREDALGAGLFADAGVILGKFDRDILAYDGPQHLLLTGGTRSGKTRGAVVPTLLASPHSIVVLDLKGELYGGDQRVGFPGTAGWRARLGPVIRFDPTSPTSDRFNLIDTIRPGPFEVRDAQNLTELIADPYGDQRFQDFWDRAAKQILAGVLLHVAYAEPAERKTLCRVFELLARFDDTAQAMQTTLHRLGPNGEPQTHPEVQRAAQSYGAYHEKLRAGIKATAESYLGLFADPLIQHNTAASTFRLSDLMCAQAPVTLYLCWPPNDAKRVKPLMRLLFGAILRDLMEHQERAADGRAKQRPLLLLLDEFPQLGKLDLFEQSMGAMAGYGLRAFMVTQSLHQITQAYGRIHTIIDNCAIVVSFAATDVETAETISKLAGDMFEMRPQETWSGKSQILGLNHRAITFREERRPLILPAEVRRLSDADELIFATGARPLKAKKLRYDEESVFAARLSPLPVPPNRTPLPSPWRDFGPLHADAPARRSPKSGAAKPPAAKSKSGKAGRTGARARKTAIDAQKPRPPAKDKSASVSPGAAPPSPAPRTEPTSPKNMPTRRRFDLMPRDAASENPGQGS